MPALTFQRFSARLLCLSALCWWGVALPVQAQQNPARRRVVGPFFKNAERTAENYQTLLQFKPISGVAVTPGARSAVFSFQTRDAAYPNLRIGTAAPVQGPQGREPQVVRWYFAADEVASAYVAPRRDRGDGLTQHTLQLQPVLAPNTTYHYIIEVGSGAAMAQEIGSFTTVSRRVKVVFQKVRVIKGGDEGGVGNTMFQFFANYDAQTNRNFVWLGGRAAPLRVPDDSWVDANKEFTLRDVDELRLAVNGYDEDFLTVGAPPVAGATSVVVGYPQNFASHNNAGAWNVASADFNLALSPPAAKAMTVPFTLHSLRVDSGSDVMFEVAGSYTIAPTLSRERFLGEAIKNRGSILGALQTAPLSAGAQQSATAVRRGAIRIPKR